MKEATYSEDGKLWKEAMVDEMASLHKNEAWDLVELLVGRKNIGIKWVFKNKTNVEGKMEKYKAQLVAKGYSQVGNDKEIIQDLKTQLSSIFDMKDLGVAKYILGMEIKRDRAKRKLWLNQRKYVETILQGFNIQDSKPVKVPIPVGVKLFVEQCPKTQEEEEDMFHVPYASAVGGLMYAMVYTRPDIAHAVGVLSKFISKPGKEHWTTVKQVFRYLCGTSDYGLCYQGRLGLNRVLDIRGFVNADWARDLDQRISTSGYAFNLFGGAVSWMSKKQSIVALSTIEEEYMTTTHARKEAVWL
eukprot:PITA_33556